jgi:Ca2+-transporting ATPase
VCVGQAGAYFALRGDLSTSLLSGLTLAMALLPEEFPVVLTVFLALGAWRLSRFGVLTRRMPSIEMLGRIVTFAAVVAQLVAPAAPPAGAGPRVVARAALACEIDPFDPGAGDRRRAGRGRAVRKTWTLERDHPLWRFLAVCHVWRSPDGRRMIAIKGASERVLQLCGSTSEMMVVEESSRKGRRVLAVAEAPWEGVLQADPTKYSFRLVGLLQLADPLRASVPSAVEQLRRAGIRVAMITGDFPGTALNIARQAGIDGGAALTGEQVASMDVPTLSDTVRRPRFNVAPRATPSMRLVQAFRAAGEVVAMTGDGVNDAAALKAAHIGIAMGRRGTDVAREAASLVLLGGRVRIDRPRRAGEGVYENIRSAMSYLVSSTCRRRDGGRPVLRGPWSCSRSVVFLEFIIDPACTPFRAEATRPFDGATATSQEPLFDSMLAIAVVVGAITLASVLLAYAWAVRSDGWPRAGRSLSAMVLGNLSLLSARSGVEPSSGPSRSDPAMWWILGAAGSALALVLYVPAFASVFRFSAPNTAGLAVALASSAFAMLACEAFKLLRAVPATSARPDTPISV